MVVARHIGRLGNNMLQIAAAIGYARKYGYEWAVDPSSGPGEPYSAIHQVFPNLPKTTRMGGNRYHEHPDNRFCPIHNTTLDVCHFNYHPIPDLGPDVVLTGFYQSYKYFENSAEEIKKVFALPHWVEYENYVSIHVRRGDYVQHAGSFPPVTREYILQALGILFTWGQRDFKLIFFSDDIAWCKENFNNWQFTPSPVGSVITTVYTPKIEFSEGRTERQDLEIMASCKHHIIANSTFSWWGAYLGHNPNRIVVSPSCEPGNWFGLDNGNKIALVDLLPPSWIQVRFR